MIRFLRIVPVLLGLVALAGVATAGEAGGLVPVVPPAAKGEACVEPVDVMRRDHMKFLMHQRDETVHGGIRGAKHSLVGCIECHAQSDASGEAIAVNARGQFCEACHRFAGARMDCFECHATVPADSQASTSPTDTMRASTSAAPPAATTGAD